MRAPTDASTPEPPEFDLPRLIWTLAHHEVRFLVVGGANALLQGADHATTDLDVLPASEVENLSRLGAALAELNARLRVADRDGCRRPYEHYVRRAVAHTAEGEPVQLAHLADVIASKEFANRPKDQAALTNLRQLLAAQECGDEH